MTRQGQINPESFKSHLIKYTVAHIISSIVFLLVMGSVVFDMTQLTLTGNNRIFIIAAGVCYVMCVLYSLRALGWLMKSGQPFGQHSVLMSRNNMSPFEEFVLPLVVIVSAYIVQLGTVYTEEVIAVSVMCSVYIPLRWYAYRGIKLTGERYQEYYSLSHTNLK
jgi:hypothetical protein